MLKDLENFTVYFETLAVGDRFRTAGRTVTEADIASFAALSADYNALHTDAEYARETPHGQRIAHGLLVLSIASGLCSRLPLMTFMERTILGLAGLECRWTRPTFIGDTIHVLLEIVGKEVSRKPDRGAVLMRRTAVNQRGETVMESDWRLVLRRQPAAAASPSS
ncbi:MaoC/PaaZ C-terminal domain-containing protein [Azospirillum sp.]|uniref:MaoC/PaaZ C-terminal domain-containing protein n=1 Tax=Azospirillum sp. TaxID=34012 RepID=UPI002D69484B|nr:MaoC/PaaZ C-terminal domain-containing protein [Azospirillum sp.]HYD70080.1 MaoC/PaaZ C-terminal domain-containing protein [Azospirillum sp.]